MVGAKIVSLLIALVWLAGCGNRPGLVVGAKNFTEQLVLGEIVAQQIERRLDLPVTRRLNLGGTLLAHEALVSGEIDLYPEYTGTALMAILDLPPEHDPHSVFHRVRQECRERFDIDWLEPFGFDNSFVMVIRGEDARAGGLKTLSDAARRNEGWTLGAGYEFERRPDGLRALQSVYGLRWKQPPVTMDLGLLYQALGQGQVTMVAANGTDGMLSKLDVRVLEDDKHAFPPYQAAVVVRLRALEKHPGLRVVLGELSGKISARKMQSLNYQVDVEHRPPREVASAFLQEMGTGSVGN